MRCKASRAFKGPFPPARHPHHCCPLVERSLGPAWSDRMYSEYLRMNHRTSVIPSVTNPVTVATAINSPKVSALRPWSRHPQDFTKSHRVHLGGKWFTGFGWICFGTICAIQPLNLNALRSVRTRVETH